MIKAGQTARSLSIKTPFKNDVAVKQWFRGFKSRFPELSIRKPQKVSTARSRSMSPVVVSAYFNELGPLMLKVSNNPSTRWNMDETGFSLEHVPQNIVARKGSHSVPGRVSCSRESITVVAAVNAAGMSLPPLVIVKGKTHRSLQSFNTADGPAGALWTWQQKAWVDDSLSPMWFRDIFLKHFGAQRPQLLILDQHRSHEVTDLLEMAVANDIIILGMPPHTSHWLQPLDKGCFGPLSKRYNVICSEFMSSNSQNVVKKCTWARLFKEAWEETMIPHNIKQGFRVTGIFPLNPAIIPSHAFAPSDCATDASYPLTNSFDPILPYSTSSTASSPSPDDSLNFQTNPVTDNDSLTDQNFSTLLPQMSDPSPSCNMSPVESYNIEVPTMSTLSSSFNVSPHESNNLNVDQIFDLLSSDEVIISVPCPPAGSVVDLQLQCSATLMIKTKHLL